MFGSWKNRGGELNHFDRYSLHPNRYAPLKVAFTILSKWFAESQPFIN